VSGVFLARAAETEKQKKERPAKRPFKVWSPFSFSRGNLGEL